jgi:hypothetical protein
MLHPFGKKCDTLQVGGRGGGGGYDTTRHAQLEASVQSFDSAVVPKVYT